MTAMHKISLQPNSRRLSVIILCSLFLILFVYRLGLFKDAKKPITLNAPPIPATDEAPDIQRYETAITRGLNYLDADAGDVSPLQMLIIDYLQRAYNLDPKFSASRRNIQPPVNEPDATDFRIFQRIITPDVTLPDSLPLDGASPLRQMMMLAAHCDHLALPSDFYALLKRNIESGEYDLTHVAFALELMSNNGCSLHDKQNEEIRSMTATGLTKLYARSDISEDLRYESVSFLLLLKRRDLVQTRWINQLSSAQRPDGGWAVLTADKQSSDHATVVALWALLQYARPAVPGTPIIRSPALVIP